MTDKSKLLAIAKEARNREFFDPTFHARVHLAAQVVGGFIRDATDDEIWAAAIGVVMADVDPESGDFIRSTLITDEDRERLESIKAEILRHGTLSIEPGEMDKLAVLLSLAQRGIASADREAVLAHTLAHTLDTIRDLSASLGSDERTT